MNKKVIFPAGIALVIVVVIVVVIVLATGGGVPKDAVAVVNGSNIKKTEFDRWYTAAAKSQTPPGQTAVVPDGPNYTKCIAASKIDLPKKLPKGQKKPTDVELKKQCEQRYESLRDSTMQFLIGADWLEGEAKDLKISIPQAEVTKEFSQLKKQQFPKEKDFQDFLKRTGFTEADLLLNQRLLLLSSKIQQKIPKGPRVDDAAISKFYKENKKRFAEDQRRDIFVILTKTVAQAEVVKKALAAGEDFKAVSDKYSIDEAAKKNGAKLPAVAKGQLEKAFDQAVFSAPLNKVQGPVKTQFGYYVFKITKNFPATQQTLAQAKDSIRQILVAENQQKAQQKFLDDFNDKWKNRTECAKGYIVQDCKNAPKPKTDTAPGSGNQPAGQ